MIFFVPMDVYRLNVDIYSLLNLCFLNEVYVTSIIIDVKLVTAFPIMMSFNDA